jgi:hypothetical protein
VSRIASAACLAAILARSVSYAADPAQIVIDCRKPLGDAAAVADFLGAGGALEMVMADPKNPIVKAWTDLGFRHFYLETIDGKSDRQPLVEPTRGADGKLAIDFTELDKRVQQIIRNLKARPHIYLGHVPRILSLRRDDPSYMVYAPKSLRDWIAALARHNAALPAQRRAGLDFIAWQDYAWSVEQHSDLTQVRRVSLVRTRWDEKQPFLTPLYAAFQMAAAMRSGKIVATSTPAPLEAMAVHTKDGSVVATANNHTGESVSAVAVFQGLPFETPKLNCAITRIDEAAADYGRGLQEQVWEMDVEIKGGSVQVPLILPAYGSAQVTLWPAYPQKDQ